MAGYHLPFTSTSYSWTKASTFVSLTYRPTLVLPTDPYFNPSLLPVSDTKEVPNPPQISPPPPDLRHAFHTFSLSQTLGTVSSSVPLFCPINLPKPDPMSYPSYILVFTRNHPHPPSGTPALIKTPSHIWTLPIYIHIPESTTNELAQKFYTLIPLPTYGSIQGSLLSPF